MQEKEEDEQINKIRSAKTGQPITLTGWAVIGPDGVDNGKRYPRKSQTEEVLKQMKKE